MARLVSLAAGAVLLFAGSAAFAEGTKPTDPQIAHIAYTAGVVDIAAAQQALKKSSNPQVKAFAQDMVRDHTSVNDQALALCKKLGVTPEDNDTSKSIAKQGEEERAKLESMSGAAFDKAYAEHEVSYHHMVNTALENTLIPGASNAELKSLLQTGLKIFKGHEEHAKALAAGLK
jgi:putative membrane protein